jgi:putative spermidine/putrescine transport system permease protein
MSRRSPLPWFALGVVGFLVAPTGIVVALSFTDRRLLLFPPRGFTLRWYGEFLTSPEWTAAAATSVRVGLLTAGCAAVLGTLTAVGLVRGRYPGRSAVLAVALSPIVVPAVVLGLGLSLAYGGWGLSGSTAGLVAAHTTLALPVVVIIVGSTLRSLDPTLELAAASLGAGPLRVFLRVTLPQLRRGMLAAAVLSFALSWDEVVVSLFLTSPTVRTLPVFMWAQVRDSLEPTIAAAAALTTAGTLLAAAVLVIVGRRWRVHR